MSVGKKFIRVIIRLHCQFLAYMTLAQIDSILFIYKNFVVTTSTKFVQNTYCWKICNNIVCHTARCFFIGSTKFV
jgi:hypothetical protein